MRKSKKEILNNINLKSTCEEMVDYYDELESYSEKFIALKRIRNKCNGTPEIILYREKLLKEEQYNNEYDEIKKRQEQRDRTLSHLKNI